jgi:hypothetical protein
MHRLHQINWIAFQFLSRGIGYCQILDSTDLDSQAKTGLKSPVQSD